MYFSLSVFSLIAGEKVLFSSIFQSVTQAACLRRNELHLSAKLALTFRSALFVLHNRKPDNRNRMRSVSENPET